MADSPALKPSNNGEIGPRLRAARQRRGFSLAQVAEATGLTKGFISQLERDRTTASVASLLAICDVLDLGVGSLFDPPSSNLIRRRDRPPINLGGEGLREWLLTPSSQKRLRVIESEVEPMGGSGSEPYAMDADTEWVHVVAGELEIRIGGTHHQIKSGDSLTFSSTEPRSWMNPSATEHARVLWVLANPRS